jgi:hypothetical protein
MSAFSRRTFLKSLGIGTGAFMLGSKLLPRASVAADTNRNFVFCYFSGGWDTLLGLDTRDPGTFTDARSAETKIELGWDRLPAAIPRAPIQPAGSNIVFGPAMGGIAQHFDRMCVVRGVSMDTVTHEVGRRYFITGLPPRGLSAAGSSAPTRIVAQQGARTPIPNLVARVETYNENLPAFATGLSISSVSDLQLSLTDGPNAPRDAVRRRLDEYRGRWTPCDPGKHDATGLMSLIKTTQLEARNLVMGSYDERFRFTSTTDPEMMAIRARYGIVQLASAQAQAAMAFQALRAAQLPASASPRSRSRRSPVKAHSAACGRPNRDRLPRLRCSRRRSHPRGRAIQAERQQLARQRHLHLGASGSMDPTARSAGRGRCRRGAKVRHRR